MRTRMMLVRTLTATVLFLILSKVNIWADTQAHLVLAVGYRAFLLGAPLFLFLGVSGGMRLALAFCVLGTTGALFSVNVWTMGVLAVGMAVSGYLAKYVAAHTSQGAADNKVSLNIGSLLSGLLLMTTLSQAHLLGLSILILMIALVAALSIDWSALMETASQATSSVQKTRLQLRPLIGWLLIGIATGIKLTGIFTILPQYLIARLGTLPMWFGSLVILNSLVVILAQHRVLAFLDRSRGTATLTVSLSAMVLLALPGVMGVENLSSAVLWILLLTLGECALSQYDRTAREAGYLFPKELMVGVGSFLTVALSRSWPQQIYWSGLVGVAALLIGAWAVRRGTRVPSVFFERAPRPPGISEMIAEVSGSGPNCLKPKLIIARAASVAIVTK